ncbi:hypothetical protein, partial [Pseudomonas syringae group genomosp. 7]|uniref:hypothetical protein n=1 Tax=Pseudomonas syringae group genomosp. 7 TaxID=251699 RepID=UPI0037705A85
IAVVLDQAPEELAAPVDCTPRSEWRRWGCGVVQGVGLAVMVSLRMTQWVAPFFTYRLVAGSRADSVGLAPRAEISVLLCAA